MTPYVPGPEQRAVIESTDKVVVVLGGAGTGKTSTAGAAARAHLERSDARQSASDASYRAASSPGPDRVLFLSFSRASVARIIDRSRAILGPYSDRVEVTTFHALAWRLIRRFGSAIDLPDPYLLTKAQAMLFPGIEALQYRDLVPKAMELLDLPVVAAHLRRRWSLIICDEFQDTDDRQYALLRAIRGKGRLILLGDPNQCIYASLPDAVGVSPERLKAALNLPGAILIELPEASYRDPSGVIPAAAAAIRRRLFDAPAVRAAIDAGRIRVANYTELDSEPAVVAEAVTTLRDEGLSVAVFSHHNDALALLSDQLTDAGVAHEITGLSESLSAAIDAQVTMAQYAARMREWKSVLQYLAIFVTSAVRGKQVPPLAYQILGQAGASGTLRQRLVALKASLDEADEPTTAFDIAARAHEGIGLPNKSSVWAEAAHMLRPMYAASMRAWPGTRPSDEQVLDMLDRIVEDRRVAMLTEDTTETEAVVQLMNLHQTKGREADATVVVLRSTDFFGTHRSEPFEEPSRLLYVVFTRARKRVIVLLFGTGFSPLIAPLVRLADGCG
ncbi:MAG: UvrD-helicase domain-containing protein [Streptosporangiaceae bacterium]